MFGLQKLEKLLSEEEDKRRMEKEKERKRKIAEKRNLEKKIL